ncbi:MAG: preprotein translocase subunit SecE [Fimbriimonadales bacterium]
MKGFFEDVSAEMRKVIWPSRDDVVRLTSMVLMVCVAFVVYLFLFERIVGFAVAALTGEKT